VTIEMRHAPFFGWIHDLSAPDPTTFVNLFGLLPFTPPEFLAGYVAIGAWPLLMGVTMYLQQKLNPQPVDPVQARMFMLLPIVFTYMLSAFPAGLVIYWAWNNLLSIASNGRSCIARAQPGAASRHAADLFPARDVESGDLVKSGRLLFARDCRFIAARPGRRRCRPKLAGIVSRTLNVGKSSLVNALTGRRTLARTSNTPGRTRQINFFALGGRLLLVDLPGYGYAEASKSAVKAWTRTVQHYLRARNTLRRVCLLIDSRHGLKEPDQPVMQLCDSAGLSYQVILTKTDKPGAAELAAVAEAVHTELTRHSAAHPEIHLTSAEKALGIAALRATLAGFAVPAELRPDVAARAVAMGRPPR
jgi:GTP-binding protein